ncbi:hypothetical protein P1X14_18140 [Sphingomonas sp. AOB5]|uniref:surface-adhesin E family protein n=1 Tax=Sphingomonas sp. AOB5 TaxID=3034017 RepID=UPI0023F72A18|nr:surface-adhesin E family protein [Sphingomonas sp. AOB5]MDF7777185.1 hypothetical protein [Sphingomonas sp. AOB5]
MIRMAGIAAAILFAAPAQAQDWRLISIEPDGPVVFLDAANIVPGEQNLRRLDLLMIRRTGDRGFSSFRVRMSVDCDKPRMRTEQVWIYADDGAEMGSGPGQNQWIDTVGENGLRTTDMVCGRKPLPDRSFGPKPPLAEARKMIEES